MKAKITAHRLVRASDFVDHSHFTYELWGVLGPIATESITAYQAAFVARHGPFGSALFKMMEAIAATSEADYDGLVGREFED
jgi:hypothetical protein